ncbi:MAG: hypothetical protein ACKV1O_30960 [Saprospiraceae bacterium]
MKPHTTAGWVLFHAETGTIWAESFSPSKKVCWAIAKEQWALKGDTKKDNPGWKPVRAQQRIVIL